LTDYNLSIFKKASRRVHVLYIDELIPNFYADHTIWMTYYKKIFKLLASKLSSFGRDIRRSGVPLVILMRPHYALSEDDVKFICALWTAMEFPTTSNSSTRFRFYLPSSCLVGSKIKEKHKHASELPKFGSFFTLFPDDLAFDQAVILAKKHKMRITFDSKKHRNEKGKRIAQGSDEWEAFSALCCDKPGNSSMYPIIFTSDKLSTDLEKMVRFYSRFTDVVFLKD